MAHASQIAVPGQMQAALIAFLARYESRPERVTAVKTALDSQAGRLWRNELGNWAAGLIPLEDLVPDAYRVWRPVVRDALQFVFSRLSSDRLAPKIVEQLEAGPDMPAEQRLLLLITRLPGLQKIGQVVARNRNFRPRFRRALSQLENGISDVGIEEARAILIDELGPRMRTYDVEIASTILSEATVSAVVRFTWRNPRSGRREQGVFKVLKPYVPDCFAEDMSLLQRLARSLTRKYSKDHSRFAGLSKALTEIRLLLAHEVDFRREQATLPEARRVYGCAPGARVPQLIGPLSTDIVTALSYEEGVKVTAAFRKHGASRTRIAERLVQRLLAVPAFSAEDKAIFHGDPHAGNLLYDRRRDDLVILDWALAEQLSREERRCVAVLVMMTMLRDPDGICAAIEQLRQHAATGDEAQRLAVRGCVDAFIGALPLANVPGALDAMSLLGDAVQEGIHLPAPLMIFRKAVFTLDGVANDVAAGVNVSYILGRYVLKHWLIAGAAVWSLLSVRDLLALEWSALTFFPRLWKQALFRKEH